MNLFTNLPRFFFFIWQSRPLRWVVFIFLTIFLHSALSLSIPFMFVSQFSSDLSLCIPSSLHTSGLRPFFGFYLKDVFTLIHPRNMSNHAIHRDLIHHGQLLLKFDSRGSSTCHRLFFLVRISFLTRLFYCRCSLLSTSHHRKLVSPTKRLCNVICTLW